MQKKCSEKYKFWCKNAKDKDILAELKEMQGKNEEIEFAFYKYLQFGTAGIRGVMGAGTNKLNIYTIIQTARAVGEYMLSFYNVEKCKNKKVLTGEANLCKQLQKVENNILNKSASQNNENNTNTENLISKGCKNIGLESVECDLEKSNIKNLNNANFSEKKNLSVVITYDSRHNSEKFAKLTACVLCDNGINCFITKSCAPTPYLSFLVEKLNCQMGVNITSSHNPKDYNGFKLYNHFGLQTNEETADKICKKIAKINPFEIKISNFEGNLQNGKIQYVEEIYEEKYLDDVFNECLLSNDNYMNNEEREENSDIKNIEDIKINSKKLVLDSKTNNNKNNDLKIVYTALNGVGERFISGILKRLKIENIIYVEEQKLPNGDFSTCPYPNPEKIESFALSIDYARKNDADLIVATDPDCDRLGVMVKDDARNYVLLNGNEVGVILCEFILSTLKAQNKLNFSPIVVRSIVTSPLVDNIVKSYHGEIIESLTGFKNIGAEIHKLEESGQIARLVFAYEESCGYLKGHYVHDKDGVVATMLICELAKFLKMQNKTLLDYLKDIKNRYGNYYNSTLIFRFDGIENERKKDKILKMLRSNLLAEFGGERVKNIIDYSIDARPELQTNAMKYIMENGDEIILRPSGTEPVVKCYITLKTGNFNEKMQKISKDLKMIFG